MQATQQQTTTGVPIGVGRVVETGPNPKLAAGLAVIVGIAVFAILWRIRKTFGMRE